MDEWERLMNTNTVNITEQINFDPNKISAVKEFFDAPQEKRITLIQPVRGADEKEPEYLIEFLEHAKTNGEKVYIPKIYNFQKDSTGGIHICNTMRYAIANSGRVVVDYNPLSEGSKFDLGLTFFNNKKIEMLNSSNNFDDEITRTITWYRNRPDHVGEYNGVPALNPIFKIEYNLRKFISPVVENIEVLETLNNDLNHCSDKIRIRFEYTPRSGPNGETLPPALSPNTAIALGMVYASQRGFTIINHQDLIHQSQLEDALEKHKSYTKVALTLDKIYNPWRE